MKRLCGALRKGQERAAKYVTPIQVLDKGNSGQITVTLKTELFLKQTN